MRALRAGPSAQFIPAAAQRARLRPCRTYVQHTVMETVPVGSYKYDLVLDRSGATEVLMEGSIKIVAGVTDI